MPYGVIMRLLQLREPYKIKYGKDIMTALDKKFSGDLEKTIFALMETPLDYDVKQLKQAMKVSNCYCIRIPNVQL